jgi:hypothetical protein
MSQHAGASVLVGPLTLPLGAIETGARVWRPSAREFDFAYHRVGRVMREGGMVGVLYDGANQVIQYGEEDPFAYAALE